MIPNFNNPYMMNPYSNIASGTVEVPHVNGRPGAESYQLPRNSSVLLLDENEPLVYLVKTDSACYKTIKTYVISEYTPQPEVDVRALLSRIENLERRLTNEPDTPKYDNKQFSSNVKSVVQHDKISAKPGTDGTTGYSK